MYNLRMNVSTIIELVGYTGSLLVIISMLMTSLTKLRVVNSIGCIVFATYALIIKSYPTAAMQACLLIINCIGLYNLSKNKKQYSITELKNGDSYINFFIESYKNDIEKFFPKVGGFSATSVSDDKAKIFLIVTGSTTVGIMLARKVSDDTLEIDMDYTVPAYRDCSAGKFLFDYLKEKGWKKLIARNEIAEHKDYLNKMGFKAQGDYFEKEFCCGERMVEHIKESSVIKFALALDIAVYK